MTRSRALAEEITKMLKFNPQLSDADRAIAIELRLDNYAQDIERACAESHKRSLANAVPISDYSSILPPEMLRKDTVMN